MLLGYSMAGLIEGGCHREAMQKLEGRQRKSAAGKYLNGASMPSMILLLKYHRRLSSPRIRAVLHLESVKEINKLF